MSGPNTETSPYPYYTASVKHHSMSCIESSHSRKTCLALMLGIRIRLPDSKSDRMPMLENCICGQDSLLTWVNVWRGRGIDFPH
jgi:hypothetical protein